MGKVTKSKFRKLKTARANSLILEWIILLICFGYPLQAMIITILGTNSTPINIFFRASYVVFSLYIIITGIRKWSFKFTTPFVIFLIFWIFYGIRIIIDTEIHGITYMSGSKYYVYGFAFGNTLIPTLAVFLNPLLVNLKRISRNLLLLVIFDNLFIITALIFYAKNGIFSLFSERSSLIVPLNGEPVNLIWSITVSYYGAILSLLVIYINLFKHDTYSFLKKPFFSIVFLIIGLFNLFAGASKGPMITFFILFLSLLVADLFINKRIKSIYHMIMIGYKKILYNKFSMYSITRIFLVILSLFSFLVVFVLILKYHDKLAMFTRLGDLLGMHSNGYNDGRFPMWQSAIEIIKKHPIFGDRFLTTFINSYSHNLIIDSLMATGIIGTIFFLVYLVYPCYYYFKLKRTNRSIFSIIGLSFLACFMVSNVSGGIWVTSDFWILSAVLIVLFENEKTNRIIKPTDFMENLRD